MTTYKKCITKTWHFIPEEKDHVLHIIKTGFEDVYIMIKEEPLNLPIGSVFTGTKDQLEKQFKIKLK